MITVQPDIQYVHRPSGDADTSDALAFGLRLILTASDPRKDAAVDADDPTLPDDQ